MKTEIYYIKNIPNKNYYHFFQLNFDTMTIEYQRITKALPLGVVVVIRWYSIFIVI